MEIKLIRTEKTPEHTLGVLQSEEKFFGYTIEPTHASMGILNKITALPEGIYAMVLRTNPIAGTPCIKVIGSNVPANSSIRCCITPNAKNPSITLVTDYKNNGDYRNVNFEAWTRLLTYLIKNESVSLIIQ